MLAFALDEEGEWIVHLDCGHRRHLRHRPPLVTTPWLLDPAEREARVGQSVECHRCARREWPDTLEAYKETRVFTEVDTPAGLLDDHRIKAGVWGRLEVLGGTLRLIFPAPIADAVELAPGEWSAIPPELPHRVELMGSARFKVVFHRLQSVAAEG
jgi:tellurite resistance-related uncharacterized protein